MSNILSTPTLASIANRTDKIRACVHRGEDLTTHQLAQLLADVDRLILHADAIAAWRIGVEQAWDGQPPTRRKDTP